MTTVPISDAKPAPRRGGFRLDPRYHPPLLVSCILLAASFTTGVVESPLKIALAIAASIVTEMGLYRFSTGKWPNVSSAYITGISIGLLDRSPFFWPYALTSVISIASKYVLRTKNRHLWNPSNFGIVAILLLAPHAVSPLSIQFGNSIGPMVVIWALGTVIIYRLKRLHICIAYAVSFVFFAVIRAVVNHHPIAAGIAPITLAHMRAVFGELKPAVAAEIAPITGPMYQLFIFFMITDPKTTVKSRSGQMLVAFLVAAVECGFRFMQNVDAPFFALAIVGPIANLVEIYWIPGTARKTVDTLVPVNGARA
ncbi:MAG TPA: hypothetical protein VFJ58_16420 [Armatimonadota bacterium]|nr:hypothetical protein [Armatimonadota bacterium]